ncbi:hypothetical protein F9288_03130 [Sphingomonas sp. CL5.1]|uniref:hypothetical protein n=1 Tax=Sphingomonas sp. CL5.1 TaxID=2653203 RepID=UPI00158248BE|nr:hypothetical protein [Sphingomonas sp. CL5.1]QKR98746.1 hypothetical protein F9288_03130 [Sphingomonas sp. CL5.1]
MDMKAARKEAGGDPRRWPAADREAFLDHLAATCNVKTAAAAGGVTGQTALRWRRHDPDFAQAWSEALALGYEMLETRLVGHALAGERGGTLAGDDDGALPPVAVELALKLLTYHRNAPGKPHRRTGPKRAYAEKDDSDRAILAKLAQIEKARAKRAAAPGAGK